MSMSNKRMKEAISKTEGVDGLVTVEEIEDLKKMDKDELATWAKQLGVEKGTDDFDELMSLVERLKAED